MAQKAGVIVAKAERNVEMTYAEIKACYKVLRVANKELLVAKSCL